MSRLTDKKIVKTTPVEVSPISTLPSGLDEGQYSDGDGLNTAVGENLDFSAPTSEAVGPPDSSAILPAPLIYGVKSQRVRHENGQAVVDVVLDVQDVEGAIHYEARYDLA